VIHQVVPSDEIVGRAAELDVLEQALADLARRRAGALEVVGEPGIGKTRLLAQLGADADARGMIVLSGSASELERGMPFWVFVDALDEYVHGLDPRRLDGLDAESRAELAHVFPSLAQDGHNGGTTVERYRTHRAVCGLLEAVATTKPLVLLLDDLHWADSGSLELLGALLRHLPSAPVLLALALRPRQVPARLEPSLERALRAHTLKRVDVGPLSRSEAAQLIGEAGASELYAQSAGNPLYLQQLARSPRQAPAGGAAEVALAGVQVPSAVARGLAEELAALADDTRVLLDGAAVAGDPFELELAAAAAQLPEAAAIDALDELIDRDLVRITDVPRRFRFRHPLVRGAIYEGTRGGWRLGAHERCAAVLERRGAPASVRAHHVEQSGRHGDAGAVAVLREAADAAAGRDPATAARLYTAALRLSGSPDGRVELLTALSGAQAATGLFHEARAALLECLELLPEHEVATRARITGTCAGLEHLLGYHEAAGRRLNDAFGTLTDTSSFEAVSLMLEIAVDGLYREDPTPARDWARRALAAAKRLGDGPLTASAAGVLAHSSAHLGAFDDAEAALAEAAEVVDALPEHELARCLDHAVCKVASTAINLGRCVQGEAYAERALAVALATGQGNVMSMRWWAGIARTYRGRLAEAADVLDTAIEVARLTGYREGLARVLTARAVCATAAGELADARAFAEEAVELLRGGDVSWPWMLANWSLASVLAETGEAERGTEILVDAYGGEAAPRVPLRGRPELYEVLARCQAACGRHEDAARTALRARECADALAIPLYTAAADRAAAAVALEAGDPAAAAEPALRAAEASETTGVVIHVARARMLAGRALAASGETERAIEELTRAATTYAACGAEPRRAEAERELRKLGLRGVHRRTRPGTRDADAIGSLTERELQVARLLVDRRTNAEIAATLFLSKKTVESHVRNLFHKLGVSSRVEVAREVERAYDGGPTDPPRP
jgi:ATP/maltotriose-dependent transcriptional regulator MalT